MNEDFRDMVLFAIESGETGPLMDWMEEHEHPQLKLMRTERPIDRHMQKCIDCQRWLLEKLGISK